MSKYRDTRLGFQSNVHEGKRKEVTQDKSLNIWLNNITKLFKLSDTYFKGIKEDEAMKTTLERAGKIGLISQKIMAFKSNIELYSVMHDIDLCEYIKKYYPENKYLKNIYCRKKEDAELTQSDEIIDLEEDNGVIELEDY